MSAPTVEYRLDTLETVLAEFIMQQNRNLTRLEREMSDFKNEMSDFKNEMKISHNKTSESNERFKEEMKISHDKTSEGMERFKEEMKISRDKTSEDMKRFKEEMKISHDKTSEDTKRFKEEMKISHDKTSEGMERFKEEMKISRDRASEEVDKYVKEGREGRREMNKKWGEVTNKLGTFAEDFVAPNIPRIATDFFKFSSIDIFNRREDRRNPQDFSQMFEFDVFAVCQAQKRIILTDVKFSVRMKYLESVKQTLENFRIAFPEYASYEVILIFASMDIAPDQVKYLTKMGIYALALGDDNMDLLNFEDLN